MKYLICSDIHGSSYYLDKLLKVYRENNYDKLIILGDVLYHGPRNDLPEMYDCKKVISMLNEIKNEIICVKGNCDSEVDQMVLNFKINEYYFFELGNRTIHLTHGHVYNYDNPFPFMNKNDILFYGHFHVPFILEKEEVLFCNPGSISLPKQKTAHSYISLTENKIEIIDLERNTIINEKQI